MKPSRRPFVTAVYEERRVDPKPDHVASETAGSASGESIGAPSGAVAGNVSTEQPRFECDLCGQQCEGAPTSSGLLLWFRGDEVRVEQPPLCEDCASRIAIGAVSRWAIEGDEED